MPSTPFPYLPSGQSFVPEVSGTGFLGSASSPFSTIYTNAITVSGAQINGFTGGAITSNLTPTTSGTLTLGTAALPFSGVYANQYATSFVNVSGATNNTINFNGGTSQFVDYTGMASGTSNLALTNGIAGSAYLLKTKQNAAGTISVNFSGGNFLWQGGASGTMTLASGTTDVFSFLYDGTKYLGSASNNYF